MTNTKYLNEKKCLEEYEKVLLGFRCKFGVDLNILSLKELKKVDDLVVENRVCIKENRVYNTNFLLADEIALYILD